MTTEERKQHARDASKKYRMLHPERHRTSVREYAKRNPAKRWSLTNPEKAKESNRQYRLAHREEIMKKGREYARRHREENLEEIRKRQRERQRAMFASDPDRVREVHRKYYLAHIDELHAKAKLYRKKHAEEILEKRRKWYLLEENRERCRGYARRKRKMRPEDQIIRHALSRMLLYSSCRKTSKSFQYIGCTPAFLRNHLEEQFKPGMTWENYGEWHVDHIVPLAWWDLRNNPEHLFIASHWTNLCPAWGKENMKKGARFATLELQKEAHNGRQL